MEELSAFREQWKDEIQKKSLASTSSDDCSEPRKRKLASSSFYYNSSTSSSTNENHLNDNNKKNNKERKVFLVEENDEDDLLNLAEDDQKKEESLLDIFIRDLDDICDVPMFDFMIPAEIAMRIFGFLEMKDLCTCACVNKAWKMLADDNSLWGKFAAEKGIRHPGHNTSPSWKTEYRQRVLKERERHQRWVEMKATLSELHQPDLDLCSLSSALRHQDFIICGYSDASIKLFDLASQQKEREISFLPALEAAGVHPASPLSYPAVNNLSMNSSILCATLTSNHLLAYSFQAEEVVSTLQLPGNHPAIECCSVSQSQPHMALSTGKNVHWIELGAAGGVDVHTVRPFPVMIKETKVISDYSYLCEGTNQVFLYTQGLNRPECIVPAPLMEGSYELGGVCLEGNKVLVSCYDGWARNLKLYNVNPPHMLRAYSDMVNSQTVDLSGPNLMFAGGPGGIQMCDMRVSRPVLVISQKMLISMYCLRGDEVKVVVGACHMLGKHSASLWDLRMSRQLWFMSCRDPVKYASYTDYHLLYSSAAPSAHKSRYASLSYDHYRPRHSGVINVMDFSPFSLGTDVSEYTEQGGYSYNIVLETPYDAI